MRGTIKSFFVVPEIVKLGKERSLSGNPRDFSLGGQRLQFDPGVDRDWIMSRGKALEMVGKDQLNPLWADQMVSVLPGQNFALGVNRVKGAAESAEVVIFEIDAERNLITSVEKAAGSSW